MYRPPFSIQPRDLLAEGGGIEPHPRKGACFRDRVRRQAVAFRNSAVNMRARRDLNPRSPDRQSGALAAMLRARIEDLNGLDTKDTKIGRFDAPAFSSILRELRVKAFDRLHMLAASNCGSS